MRVAPDSANVSSSPAAQANQGTPGQSQPSGGAPQQDGPAAKSLKMIQSGFKQLGQLMQQAGPSLPPEDMKLFQMAVSATDNLIQSLSGPAGQQSAQAAPKGAPASQPMPMNANAKAQAMPPGSY